MGKQRYNLTLSKDLVDSAKLYAVKENLSFSGLIENLIEKNVPKAIGFERGRGFQSGATISKLGR